MYNLKAPQNPQNHSTFQDIFTEAGLPAGAPIVQTDGLNIEDCAMPGSLHQGAPGLGTIGKADLPPVIISMAGYTNGDFPAPGTPITPQTDDYVEGFNMGYFEGAMEALVNIVNGVPEDVAERVAAFTEWVSQSFGIVLEDA